MKSEDKVSNEQIEMIASPNMKNASNLQKESCLNLSEKKIILNDNLMMCNSNLKDNYSSLNDSTPSNILDRINMNNTNMNDDTESKHNNITDISNLNNNNEMLNITKSRLPSLQAPLNLSPLLGGSLLQEHTLAMSSRLGISSGTNQNQQESF